MRSKYLFVSAACLIMAGLVAAASTDETSRLQNAATVVSALRTQPDNAIPEKLWQKAACVVVIPNLKKAAFGIGGEYGKGVMSCRKADGWGAMTRENWAAQIKTYADLGQFKEKTPTVDEVMTLFRATGLRKIGPGEGDGSEDITVYEVPLADVEAWLADRCRRDGCLVDIKLYAGVYFATK